MVPHAKEDPQAREAAPAAEDKEIDTPAAEETTPAAEVANLAPAASAAIGEPIAEAVMALPSSLRRGQRDQSWTSRQVCTSSTRLRQSSLSMVGPSRRCSRSWSLSPSPKCLPLPQRVRPCV